MKNFALLLSLAFTIPAFSQDSNSPLVSFDHYELLMKEVKEHRKTRLVDLNTFNAMSTEPDVYILDTRSKEMYDRKHVKGAIHLNFSDFTQANLDKLFLNRNATILIYCNNNFMDEQFLSLSLADQLSRPMQDFASKVSYPDFSLQIIEFSSLEQGQLSAPQSIQSFNSIETETEIEEIEIDTIDETEAMKNMLRMNDSSITLALNIPTYINLYGYGYKNVYELNELISIYDPRIQFEGTEVIPVEN